MTASPGQHVRILFVEDNPDDVMLELAELRSGNLVVEHEVVETPSAVDHALRSKEWDVVISDFRMPEMSGVDTIRIAKTVAPLVPVILVSGTVGEAVAVEMMRAGASDYVLKDNLTRLPSAVHRELQQADARRSGYISRLGLRVLAGVGATVATTLHSASMLASVPRAIVGELGELCVVDLVGEHGAIQRAAAAHVDAAKDKELRDLDGIHRPSRDAREPAELAVQTRAPVVTDLASPPQQVAASSFVAIARALGVTTAISVPLVSNDTVVGVLNLASRRAYHALEIQVVEELARRIAMAIDNALLYERAQRAIQIRDEFLSIASHELKTPLMSLQLQLESIDLLRAAKPHATISDDKVVNKLRVLDRQVGRLTALIHNLLNVTRIISGRFELRPERLPIADLVDSVIDQMHDWIERSRCRVSVEIEPGLEGTWDRTYLEMIVTNLLANAIKYGAGAAVEVVARRASGTMVLSVRDHGIGLTPEQRARIFDRFERAVPPEHYGGLGLGLWIVQQIVTAHGGTVLVDSTPGSGSTFTVRLPIGEPAAAT